MTDTFERRAVISGVGQSAIGRQIDRSGFQLTLDAVLAAVDDAGLTVDDIDGLAMFPGGGKPQPARLRHRRPLRGPGRAAHHARRWRQGPVEGDEPAVLRAGHGRRHRPGPPRGGLPHGQGGQRGPQRAADVPPTGRPSRRPRDRWRGCCPSAMLSPVCQVAPYATRYLHDFGVTREQLGVDPGDASGPTPRATPTPCTAIR